MKDVNIPAEIKRFFEMDGSRSLLIKGPAGTGKTTLALQIMEDLGTPESSFYLTTRVSDEALFQQFPWLKDEEKKRKIVDAGKILLENLYGNKKQRVGETPDTVGVAKKFLKNIVDASEPENVERSNMNRTFAKYGRIPEIEYTYDRIDRTLPKRAMIVIDSVEGITHKYGVDKEDFIMMLQKDLVESSNTHVIFILEKESEVDLEYLVDGVVSLTAYEEDSKRVRETALEKLRAVSISQPKYVFTLNRGKFRSFDIGDTTCDKTGPWREIADPPGMYSTGIPDFDNILGGGYKHGSYNAVELDPNVSLKDFYLIIRPIWMNFVAHDRGIVAVPVGGDTPDHIMKDASIFFGEDKAHNLADKYVRIIDYFSDEDNRTFVLPMAGKDTDDIIEMYTENLRQVRGENNTPIMDYVGFDTIEYLRGDNIAIRDLLSTVSKTKKTEDVGLCVVRPGLKLTQEIMNLADTYIRLFVKDRVLFLYGIKPRTGVYAVIIDEDRGLPYIKLEPMV